MELFTFRWEYPEDGFVLTDDLVFRYKSDAITGTQKQQGLCLMPKPGKSRQYTPLSDENIGLHRTFANLQNPTDILLFANEYGMLTNGDMEEKVYACSGEILNIESVAKWQEKINEMGVLIKLWDWLQMVEDKGKIRSQKTISAGHRNLKKHIIWRQSGVWFEFLPANDIQEWIGGGDWGIYAWDKEERKWLPVKYKDDYGVYQVLEGHKMRDIGRYYRRYLITETSCNPTIKEWAKEMDIVGPTKLFIAQEISKNLEGVVSAGIFLNNSLSFNTFLRPKTLLAALWVQFSWEVQGIQKPCQCIVCGKWFPGRPQTKTCGEKTTTGNRRSSCRQELSRRKKWVFDMFEMGHNVEFIVNALINNGKNLPIDVLEQWHEEFYRQKATKK